MPPSLDDSSKNKLITTPVKIFRPNDESLSDPNTKGRERIIMAINVNGFMIR